MKLIRYLMLVAAMLLLNPTDSLAQFNPTNPAEPTTPQPTYRLTTRVTPANAGSVTSSTRLEAGKSIRLSASPNTNFQFLRWENEDGEIVSAQNSFEYYMPAKAVTLTAVFKYNPNGPTEPTTPVESADVKISVLPAGAGSIQGEGKYTVGTNISVRTYPYSNYTFANWTRNGEVISESQSFSYAVLPDDNNLVANYRFTPGSPAEPESTAKKYKLYLKVDPNQAGYLNVSSGNSYAAGSSIYLNAYAYSDYIFSHWENSEGNVVSTSPNFNFIMEESNTTLTARYRFSPTSPSEPETTQPRRNIIYGARQTVNPGSAILYAINLENIDNLNGLAVDISIPEGYYADFSQARLTLRAESSQFTVHDLGSGSWRIQVNGTSELKGGNGAIILVPITVPTNAEPGTSIMVPLAKGVIYKTDGTQNAIDVTNGILKIAETEITLPDSPDFVITKADVTASTLKPGETLEVRWTVSNKGNIAANSGWSETVSLLDTEGTRSALGTVYFDTTGLGIGESVERTAIFSIPVIPGLDGAANIQISLIPYASSGEIEEYQINNTYTGSGEPLTIEKALMLTVPESLTEGSNYQVRMRLDRSGNRSTSETYILRKLAGDDRMRLPESVIIPRGQSGAYFVAYIDNNESLDYSSLFTIQASGNGYKPVEVSLHIEDDEFPEIEIELNAKTLTEGESSTLTITLPKPTTTDLTVSLTCDTPRLTLPESVTISTGESTATVEVIATENEKIENKVDVTITASAPQYTTGETFVFIEDNDMPVLNLELTPSAVSEGAGQRAIRGVVSRSTNLAARVTVLLSDNSVNALTYPSKVVLDPNVESYDFNIGIIDNQRVEGDRKIELTAAVFLSSCSCSALGESNGSVSKTITIIDNDGPALDLSATTSTLRRDLTTTTLTISRNTSTATALTVTLAADKDGLLNFPELVQIPAGQSSTTVTIEAKDSAFSGNENTVTLTASKEGMSIGTALILISDRTLPDATVTIASNIQENVAPRAKFSVTATVVNEGNASLPDAAPVDFYLSNNNVCITTLYTTKELAPGEQTTVTAEITAPAIPGDYMLSAMVNANGGTTELTRTNNESAKITITVKSPFNASINVNRNDILPGEAVTVSGYAPGFSDSLEVYYITDGFRLTTIATPDDSGSFTTEIVPEIAGDYIVGVCVPGENKVEEMCTFSVRGIQVDNTSFLTYDISQGESKTLSLKITNSSSLPITGLSVNGVNTPDNCNLSVTVPDQISAGKSVEAMITITGKEISNGDEWQKFSLQIVADKGVESSKSVLYYCRPNTAKLITSVNRISTTMTMGRQNAYRFKIANNGKRSTGDIILSLPIFMQHGTTTTLPSLNQGEQAEVTLLLTPNSEMQLNVPITGQIGINCQGGAGVALPFEVEPVSDQNGHLIVDARDEYTFYTESQPHVAGATVIITHPVSGAMIASGTTDDNGLWSIDLPSGFYNFEVSASKHQSASGTLQVAPGRDNEWPVFLSFNAITYDWTVVETTVDDEYEIINTVDFETRVPKPVVLVEFPDLKYANQIAYITVTNKGLIEATNVQVLTPEPTDEVQMEIIGENLIPVLGAGETRKIPLRVSVDEEGKYDDFKKYIASGATYGIADNDSEGTRTLRANGRSSGCVSVDCDVVVDNYKCDEITGEAKADGTTVIKGSYRTGTCGSNLGTPIRGGSVKVPPTLPGGFSNPHGSSGNGGGSSVSAWESYVAHRPYQWAMYGCTSDCEKKIGEAAKACWDAYWQCKKWTKPQKGHVKEYLKECAKDSKEKCTPRFDDIFDKFKDRLDECKGSGGNCADGKGCLEQLWECLKSIKDAFDSCKALKKHIDNRNAPYAQRIPLENLDDPQVKRMESVMAYLDYMHLTNTYQANILGPGDWTSVSGIEIDAMINNALSHTDEEGYIIVDSELMNTKPAEISTESFLSFVERCNNTFRFEKTGEKAVNMYDFDLEATLYDTAADIFDRMEQMGYKDLNELTESAADAIEGYLDMAETPSDGVCATITIEFQQTMVLTRQAFRGTLTITNGNDEAAMTDIKLQMKVRDAAGNLVGERGFSVSAESMEGFKGSLNLSSGWELPAKETGKTTILFVPSKYAAPVEPLMYTFGGILSYVDPFSGEDISIELTPVEMTVSPAPVLDLDYFMQRNVMGDDPLTERIERSEEAEFALLISNKGYGEASNLRMTTAQPKIVENQKGLAIDFGITASSLNGTNSNVAIGELIPTEFGTIAPNSSVYAQWMIKSSLMGHFSKYDTKATQISAYGSEDMSLLDRVEIHELIHGFTPEASAEGARGFLVNDIDDVNGKPDNIYFSECATVSEVAEASAITINEESATSATVKVTATGPGWIYAGADTPWKDSRIVTSVIRESDGAELPTDNFWCTYVTLPTGGSPIYEEKLHGIVNLTGTVETYHLTLQQRPHIDLTVNSFEGVPEEGEMQLTPIGEIGVSFSKLIDEDTFKPECVNITCDGEPIPTNEITIETRAQALSRHAISINRRSFNSDYVIRLGNGAIRSGFYVLSIDTRNIIDNEGYRGVEMKSVSWSQLQDGKVLVTTFATPAEGGSTTPASERVDYKTNVILCATPAEGYEFKGWSKEGTSVSANTEYSFSATEDADYEATFELRRVNVEVDYDAEEGTVSGNGSGLYPYGTRINITAVPNIGYTFSHWTNDAGDELSKDATLSIIATEDTKLRPIFGATSVGVETLVEKDNVRIYPNPVHARLNIVGEFEVIQKLTFITIDGKTVRILSGYRPGDKIDVTKLHNGLYILQVETDRGTTTHELLKN